MAYKRLISMLALSAGVWLPAPILAQPGGVQPLKAAPLKTVEQPDSGRTRDELYQLLNHYPTSVGYVLALDPSLAGNEAYLAPYPALAAFLSGHPEIGRNPSYYFNEDRRFERPREEIGRALLGGLGAFVGFGMAIGLLTWLIRTVIDYRRWSRLAKVQTDVHAKLLDRFTANNDLLAYIQSPAGSKFLQSSPILLDAGPRSVGAPLGRILWSVQASLVLTALGFGLEVVSARVTDDAAQPIHALGILGIALGLGFVISAIISFVISRRLGLIEARTPGVEDAPR